MRLLFFILTIFIPFLSLGQTRVLQPRPIKIDLANPKAGFSDLSKEEKKKWKAIQKEKKATLKGQEKYYQDKIDSANLANYAKYQALDNNNLEGSTRDNIKSISESYASPYKQQLKSKFNLPDTMQLDKLSDSSYVNQLNPELKASIQKEILAYVAQYTSLSPDSIQTLMDNGKYIYTPDGLLLTSDSLQNFQPQYRYYQDSLQSAIAASATEHLETQAMSTLGQQGASSQLGAIGQEEQMMFSSFEEMIASDEYLKLMESMPGKKAEIEKGMSNPTINKADLPPLTNYFEGHEDELSTAVAALSLAQSKPSFKEVLAEFFNQDMEGVQEQKAIERFSLSGYIQISSYDPVMIDYSPNLSYGFTGKASVGAGVSGRIKFGDGPDDKKDLFAYRGFMEYDLFKGIYLHGEYERSGIKVADTLSDQTHREWSDRWLLGIGKDIKLKGFLDGSILILYNFDEDLENSPNPGRIQVRYGIKF